eukprot:GEMP01082288.1.p1 GENE.GEMP01082288.1~~GEMP01082288.1.p1  ORF type:complete len:333 (+),score=49.74 GEMP01082288.1:35-1033(+)
MAIGFQWLNKHGTPKGSQDAAVEEKRIELVDKESQTESCVIYAPLETRVIDPAGVDGAIEDFYQSLQKWVDREQLKLQAAEAENEQIHETMQLVMQKLRAYQDQYACNQPIPADAKLDTEALPMFLEGVLKDARNLDRIRLALAELMQNRFDEELAAPLRGEGASQNRRILSCVSIKASVRQLSEDDAFRWLLSTQKALRIHFCPWSTMDWPPLLKRTLRKFRNWITGHPRDQNEKIEGVVADLGPVLVQAVVIAAIEDAHIRGDVATRAAAIAGNTNWKGRGGAYQDSFFRREKLKDITLAQTTKNECCGCDLPTFCVNVFIFSVQQDMDA